MKVLLVAHSISSLRGSEPGLSWNWAHYLSSEHEVWVVSHPEDRADVDRYLAAHPNDNLHITWLQGSNWDPAAGKRGLARHYIKWLRQAEQLAADLHSRIGFDVVHHVSFGTISAPPRLWRLGIPFVWGPIGGAQTPPPSLMQLFGKKRLLEQARTWRVRMLPYLPSLRTAVRKTAITLATNYETQRMLLAAGAKSAPLFWDNGIPDHQILAEPPEHGSSEKIRILWASKLDLQKALRLALEAISLVPRDLPVEMVVAGAGPDLEASLKRVTELAINDRVRFLGALSPEQMQDQFKAADIFLFTSIRDSCASVVLEAMSRALPVITLNLHGVGAYMPDAAGIKVPVAGFQEVAKDLAEAIVRLASDPTLRREQGIEGWKHSQQRRWTERADMMTKIYQDVSRES